MVSTLVWLAATTPPAQPTVDPSRISPGMAGAVVTFLLALALIVLVRSMVGHLRKVRYSPEPGEPTGTLGPDGSATANGGKSPG